MKRSRIILTALIFVACACVSKGDETKYRPLTLAAPDCTFTIQSGVPLLGYWDFSGATSVSGIPGAAVGGHTNWDTAYSERRQWDGGSTNLVAATGRTSLGVVIGTNVEAWSQDLDAIASLVSTADTFIYYTGSHSAALATVTSFARSLLDDTSATQMRNTINAAGIGVSNSFGAGAKQIFQASASTAGLNFAGVTSDPSSLASGDAWFRTDLHALKFSDGTGSFAISGNNSGDQNEFSSIAVSGQTTVTPASTTATLTLAAGSGLTITTDNTTKTVSFAVSGGTFLAAADIDTSLEIANIVGDETGSGSGGVLVFNRNPTFVVGINSPAVNVTGTAGAGYLNFTNQSATPTTPASGKSIAYFDNTGTGRFSLLNSSGFILTLDGTGLTASRVKTWADTAGTIVDTGVTGLVTDAMSALAVKPACAVVATTNLTLSGEQTIDGITTIGSLVLATAQTTASQNGPWVTASGSWTRPTWFTNGSTTQAPQFSTVFIRLGTLHQGSEWRMTTATVTIGTTSQTWVETPKVLNSGSVAGQLLEANGGTGANNTPGAAGHVLRSNGTHYVDSAIQVADVPTINQNTTGNAATATSLATGNTINGVNFNGASPIVISNLSQEFNLSGSGSFTLAGDQDNWNPTGIGNDSILRIDCNGADRNITGIVAPAIAGKVLGLINNGSANKFVLVDQSGSSSASNQFLFGSNIEVPPNKCVLIRYDSASNKWREFGRSLANTGVTAGAYGDASHVATVTFDAQGRATAASNTAIAIAASAAGLGSVTNDAQTKAAIFPNTAPSSGQIPIGSGTAYVPQTVTGDWTVNSSGVATIANDAVTYAKMQNMVNNRVLGNISGSTGDPSELSGANLWTMMSGQAGADVSMNSHKLTSMVDPSSAQDAATKNYVDGRGYVLQAEISSGFNPADAVIYYVGSLPGATLALRASGSNGWINQRMYVLQTGTIKKVVFHFAVSGAGTTESVSHYIRLNDSSDFTALSTTETYDSSPKDFVYTGLAFSVTAGDYIAFKIASPTWATNPTGLQGSVQIYIQ